MRKWVEMNLRCRKVIEINVLSTDIWNNESCHISSYIWRSGNGGLTLQEKCPKRNEKE